MIALKGKDYIGDKINTQIIQPLINSTEPEDLQDIAGHLCEGIPKLDIETLDRHWQIMPGVRAAFFQPGDRPGYYHLQLPITEVKAAILEHPEFTAFMAAATQLFEQWQGVNRPRLMGFDRGGHPKELIDMIAEDLLSVFKTAPLLDAYDLYQHLMDYWAETMQDDCYIISVDGWVAQTSRIMDKKGTAKDKGWGCNLVPKGLVVARYFATEQAAIEAQQADLESVTAWLTELEEEHSGEEGFLEALDKINKAQVSARLKEVKGDKEAKEEIGVLKEWLRLNTEVASYKKVIKEADAALDKLAYEKYPELTEAEVKQLVVEDKWLHVLREAVQTELDRVSQTLTGRIRQLAERYATPLPQLVAEVETLSARVEEHLLKMGAVWN